jgi:hypothetical protein
MAHADGTGALRGADGGAAGRQGLTGDSLARTEILGLIDASSGLCTGDP